jgi:3-methyladenine DNA glycosylase AlkD
MKIMNSSFNFLKKELLELEQKSQYKSDRFFKKNSGDYAHQDKFLGIKVPDLRKLVKEIKDINLENILELLQSPYNEYRLLALFFLVDKYQQGDIAVKKEVYNFYIKNIIFVNNWNLVDSSAHLILGAHVYYKLASEDIINKFSISNNLWRKRIAMVATWYFIRKNKFELALTISKKLLSDNHDLIHKAVGWMLREVGKKDKNTLINFLDQNVIYMPRTALRYAIEHFDDIARKKYINMKKIKKGIL